jgi:hypothetical protein
MSDKEFNVIQSEELPNGEFIITLTQPFISGHWTVFASTDGYSDRVIAPSGKFITIGPTSSPIPHQLWDACAKAMSV